MSKLDKTCPSSSIQLDANLLGAVNEDGSVGFFSNPVKVDEEMIASLQKINDPETKFRFSNTCIEKGCNQWKNGACSIIKNVMQNNMELELVANLPNCSIRPTCRWYAQEGSSACSFCPHIITNMMEKEALIYF
jgi:hypothetical protein